MEEKNLKALKAAGILPPGESQFTEAEKAAIATLSEDEIDAIISAKDKLGVQFFLKNCASGYY